MVHTRKPVPLHDILKSLIDDMGIRQKLDEVRTVETWASIAGRQINAVTERVWVKGDSLFVQINSSVWRQELHMQRGAWCIRLNQVLGSELVREIIFR